MLEVYVVARASLHNFCVVMPKLQPRPPLTGVSKESPGAVQRVSETVSKQSPESQKTVLRLF